MQHNNSNNLGFIQNVLSNQRSMTNISIIPRCQEKPPFTLLAAHELNAQLMIPLPNTAAIEINITTATR